MKRITSNTRKPNGEKMGNVLISIDDGFVEYTYRIKIGGDKTIHGTAEQIEKIFKKKMKCLGIRTRSGDIVKRNDLMGKNR